jgi:hypothetical protein
MLKAISAASRVNEFRLQTLEIERDGFASQNVQVLKGNGAHVSDEQAFDRFQRRRRVAGPMNTFEIGFEIEIRRHDLSSVIRPRFTDARAARSCAVLLKF